MASISVAKSRGATLRVGPELEIPSVSVLQPSCFRSDLLLLVVTVVMITFWKVRMLQQTLLVAHYRTGDTVFIHGKFWQGSYHRMRPSASFAISECKHSM
jgi:hypothetical protein